MHSPSPTRTPRAHCAPLVDPTRLDSTRHGPTSVDPRDDTGATQERARIANAMATILPADKHPNRLPGGPLLQRRPRRLARSQADQCLCRLLAHLALAVWHQRGPLRHALGMVHPARLLQFDPVVLSSYQDSSKTCPSSSTSRASANFAGSTSTSNSRPSQTA